MVQNQNMRILAGFIIGVLVGVGGYWLVAHRAGSANQSLMSNNESATSSEDMNMQENTVSNSNLVIQDQAPGNSVMVTSVTLTKPGWVAIQDNVNGQPGRILGATLFDVGTHSGKVDLLRNTVEGKTYFAVIHTDDGNYHLFTPKTDKVMTDSTGAPVMTQFTATVHPTASSASPEPSPAPSASASVSTGGLLNL